MPEDQVANPLFKINIRPSSIAYLLHLLDANQAQNPDELALAQDIYNALETAHKAMMSHLEAQSAARRAAADL